MSTSRNVSRTRGFAVIAVLIVLALMLSLGLTYMQHAGLHPRSSPAYRTAVQAGEDADSALAFTRTAIRAGDESGEFVVPVGDKNAAAEATELASNHLRWESAAFDGEGMGSTLVIESERVPTAGDLGVSSPDQLPSLPADFVTSLLADTGVNKIYVDVDTTWTDTDVEGVVVLAQGVTLTVDGVVIQGAVVSDAALDDDPIGAYDDAQAPTIYVQGSFHIESSDAIPGVAVLLPDGKFVTGSGMDESFQVGGAVVAWSVLLDARGSIDGCVASGELSLADEVERPGHGREPQELPDTLEPGVAWEDSFMAFVPREQTAEQLEAVTKYWKNKKGGQ